MPRPQPRRPPRWPARAEPDPSSGRPRDLATSRPNWVPRRWRFSRLLQRGACRAVTNAVRCRCRHCHQAQVSAGMRPASTCPAPAMASSRRAVQIQPWGVRSAPKACRVIDAHAPQRRVLLQREVQHVDIDQQLTRRREVAFEFATGAKCEDADSDSEVVHGLNGCVSRQPVLPDAQEPRGTDALADQGVVRQPQPALRPRMAFGPVGDDHGILAYARSDR